MLSDWWAALLDLIYPPRCPVCRSPVAIHGAWCPVCLAPVLAGHELNLAGRRLAALDSCRVRCDYVAGVKTLLHRLKFRGDTRAAASLAWLLTARRDGLRLAGIQVVVPVPLHPGRHAERGYNQTELIFRRWSERQGLPWLDALVRTRPTAPQWELVPAERRRNVRGAFALAHPEAIRGKIVLLVDDIVTTGATVNECAKVLKRGGAKAVHALALAGGDYGR
ncbi:ComF family protein [Anaeroselena agilis]|uniref:ComF family protein n=1 Tax=Anaeroselena agilis TaxID=3063788 RepID=A0ABU3P6V7_9FIRM|nr:ComF family protein [Selenomonadales bacterium 4137-cl]